VDILRFKQIGAW